MALVTVAIGAVLFANAFPMGGEAATASSLGTAQNFAVLAGSTVTNTGSSTVYGSLGVDPGTAISGFPPGIVTGGVIHSADAVALQAQNDVTTAYNALGAQACDHDLTGQDLGGMTLLPGVYCFSSSAQLTGALTLDAQGDAGAVFVFQIETTLTTASNSSVNVINGGSACNVYWKIGSSATLGTTTAFSGNILALASITLNTGAGVIGRALAQTGAVTMDTNNITIAGCIAAPETPTTTPVTTPATIPVTTPGTTPATTPVTTPGTTPAATPTEVAGGTPPTGGSSGTPGAPGGTEATPTGNATSTPTSGGTTTTPSTNNGGTTVAGNDTAGTPTPGATAQATTISFPNTGSVGLVANDNSRASSESRFALMAALALLFTGVGFVAMKRYRR